MEKNNRKTAFFIDGSRRVGKTYIAKEFARNEYKTYLLIDFYAATDEIKNIFLQNKDNLNNLFINLSLYYNVTLYPGESIIIFDEIQFFPEARGLIKYLIEDGRFDYIETGSLVSIKKNIENILIPSEEHHETMYPMDFEEFLDALNQTNLYEYIKEMYKKLQPIPDAIHRKIMNLFNVYTIIGGMPQVVFNYVQNQNNKERNN